MSDDAPGSDGRLKAVSLATAAEDVKQMEKRKGQHVDRRV